tara:strand:+ start:908 stop:1417 length:510 start_codon:yes stop_codon:yes gene_type:complete
MKSIECNESVKQEFIKGLDEIIEFGFVNDNDAPFWQILNVLTEDIPEYHEDIGGVVFSGKLACWMTGQEVTDELSSTDVSIHEEQSVFEQLNPIDSLQDAFIFLRLLLIKNVVSLRVDYRIDPETNKRCPYYHPFIFLEVAAEDKEIEKNGHAELDLENRFSMLRALID